MTCRHAPGDPNCSSSLNFRGGDGGTTPSTPDAERFEIVEAEEVGQHFVAKVRYPNCRRCSYEGVKVIVWFNVGFRDAIRWRKIDPHFRDPTKTHAVKHEAPGPAARFPASDEGWTDALAYARSKTK